MKNQRTVNFSQSPNYNPNKDHKMEHLVTRLIIRELQLTPEYTGFLLRILEEHDLS